MALFQLDHLETQIDTLLLTYVQHTSSLFCEILGLIVAAGLALHYTVLAMAIARGDVTRPMNELVREAFTTTLIIAIALVGGSYQSIIIDGAHAVQSLLVAGLSHESTDTVGGVLNELWIATEVPLYGVPVPAATAFWNLALENASSTTGTPDWTFSIAAALVWCSMSALSILTLLPLLFAKVSLSLVLAVGPVFVIAAIWPATRKLFSAWLSCLLGNALTLALVTAICTLLPLTFKTLLEDALLAPNLTDLNAIGLALNIFIVGVGLGATAYYASHLGHQLAGGGLALNNPSMAGALISPVAQAWQQWRQGSTTSDATSVAPSTALSTHAPVTVTVPPTSALQQWSSAMSSIGNEVAQRTVQRIQKGLSSH